MTEKLCIFCRHLKFSGGGYGEYADPASLTCGKEHNIHTSKDDWNWEKFVYDIEDFRRVIIHAKDCPDYDEAK